MNDIEEFFDIVGTERLPEYHFYYLDNGALWGIRFNSRKPKPGHMPWPLVWKRGTGSRRLGLAIADYIRKGKATAHEHTDEIRWRCDNDN